MHVRQWAFLLAVLLGLGAGLPARPAWAVDQPVSPLAHDTPTNSGIDVSCQAGQCFVNLDLGDMKVGAPAPADQPTSFNLPADKVGFLGAAGIQIGDRLTVTLPFGNIVIPEGDFSVRLDEAGKLEYLHGNAKTIVPEFNLLGNTRIVGPFGAEFGYDYGSTLGELQPLLDANQRYLFFHLGSGFTLDTQVAGADGSKQPVTLTVPQGQEATVVIDPELPLVYLKGQFSVPQSVPLALLAGAAGLNVAALPLIQGLVLPTRTTVGIETLLSRDMNRNFVQLTGGLDVSGGPLAAILKADAQPLTLNGAARIDHTGFLIDGVASSAVMPKTLLDTNAMVELFVPFSLDRAPYVRAGGKMLLPVAGVNAQGEGKLSGDAAVAAAGKALADAQVQGPALWNKAGTWMGDVASNVAGGAQTSLAVVQSATANSKDALLNGTGAAAGAVASGAAAAGTAVAQGAATAAGAVAQGAAAAGGAVAQGAAAAGSAVGQGAAGAGGAWQATAAAAACGWETAQSWWCRTTGLCQVQNPTCGQPAPAPGK